MDSKWSISPTFSALSWTAFAHTIFDDFNGNSIWLKCTKTNAWCKSRNLKYTVKFQQKCWQNRITSFSHFTLGWRLYTLRKLVGEIDSSGLYFKHVTIINYTSRGVNKLRASLNDDARVIIYDRHMFIVQATGDIFINTFGTKEKHHLGSKCLIFLWQT